MPRHSLEFRVVVASPSDVFETRKFVFDAIHELDRTFEVQNIAIRGLGWEEYATPGIAGEAQDVINKQILQEYDILIAIFGTKLGSPTKSNSSGTVAEIEHAIAKNDSDMGLHRVQVYFCDKIESLSNTSIDELKRLDEYRKSLSERGVLYRVFSTGDQLQREIRVNVQRPIAEFLHKQDRNTKPRTAAKESAYAETSSLEDASNKQNVVDDLGILDHQEKAEIAILAGNKSVDAMSALMAEINVETDRNVELLENVSSPLVSAVDKKTVVNSFATFLKSRAVRLKQEALAAKTNYFDFFDAVAFVIEMEREFADPEKYRADVATFLKHTEGVMNVIPKSRESISSFKKTLESMPRITIQFNQAKRVLIDALEECALVFLFRGSLHYEPNAG
jgi:hypothetical protein